VQPLIDTVLKERRKANRKGASDLSLSYQAANCHPRMVLITPMPQYVKLPQLSAEGRQVQTGTRRNTMWRQCFSVTFLKCGERLFASFSTLIHHVRSDNAPTWAGPGAVSLAPAISRRANHRSAQRASFGHYSLNYCVCTPNLNLQASCTSSAKTISAPLNADISVSSSHEKAKTYTQVIHVGFFDSAGMEILPGARLQSHGWHQHPHRSEPRTAGRPTGQTVWLAVERC
jgi:hypothetical protein